MEENSDETITAIIEDRQNSLFYSLFPREILKVYD